MSEVHHRSERFFLLELNDDEITTGVQDIDHPQHGTCAGKEVGGWGGGINVQLSVHE